jgi:3-keto-5-aminohexanoate cleavage enzyme
MEKLIITAAICGAEVTKEHNQAVPYTIAEIAREAKAAYEAGASIIHLHVREDDGTPTQSKQRFAVAIDAIRAAAPNVIIQPSTGGAVGMSDEERLQPLSLHPEMATLDCGTVNFGGGEIFTNSEETVIHFASNMKRLCIKPELEVFDRGMVQMAHRLQEMSLLEGIPHFNLVMGTPFGMPAGIDDLLYLVNSLRDPSTFTATGIGRNAFTVACTSILLGGHVRVGFEDNVYLAKGVLARSNGELVDKVVRLATELGREIASPQEARMILGLQREQT